MDGNISKDSKKPGILIVDDEPMIRELLETAMKKDYDCAFAANGKDALELMKKTPVDVVVTDIDMPVMDGIELSQNIKSKFTADIIIITGQITRYKYDDIITIGASDFVEKPFSTREMILRVDRVLQERKLKRLASQAHQDLKESYIDSIHRLVMAAEYKDEDTGDHIIRIGRYCSLLAKKLKLAEEFIDTIYYAAPMHDIGKIGIPDKILIKPDKLTHIEFETIKTHTQIGGRLLSRSKSRILQMAHEIALTHHEKYDGTGYPNQLKGKSIPISGRIVALADTFDALISRRPYKDPYPFKITYDLLKKERNKHFDPDVLDVFLKHFDDFLEIRGNIGTYDGESNEYFKLSSRDADLSK